MANSVEIRSPFVDYKFVEFVTSLPQEMKYNGSPKGFYRECLRGIVPDYILDARKRGFEPPRDFIRKMCDSYKYRMISSDYKFFNSLVADRILFDMQKVYDKDK
jgi:asparagine synthase (glutamine-hydrolysing)